MTLAAWKKTLWRAVNLDGKYIALIFIAVSAAYLVTYTNACTLLRIYSPHDDSLLFRMGANIAAGKWLGEYHPLLLSKMPMYSVFLSLSMITGLPYLWMTATCRIAAVAFLLRKSLYLFDKAKTLALLMGLLLLLDPAFAYELRIYRYQLPAFCLIVLLASLVALFNPAGSKQHWAMELADICITFTAFGFLWFSREENILYLGFVAAALLAFFAVRKNIASPWRNLRPLLYGLTGAVVCWLVICSMNYKHYSRFIVLDKTSPPYTDAIKTFHRVSDPDFPDFITGSGASTRKILRVGEHVPFFKQMSEHLVAIGSRWPVRDYFDRDKLELFHMLPNIPTVSHFEWAWVDAAMAAGHGGSAADFAAFHSSLDKEIKKAVEEGKLSYRDDVFLIGPYFLFKKDIATIFKLLVKYYFHFIPTPNKFAERYRDLMVQVSPHNMGNKIFWDQWAGILKVKYISDDDIKKDPQLHEKALNSFSNNIWNKITAVYSFSAVPLMHLAAPAALAALLFSLRRRRFAAAAAVALPTMMYAAYYCMLTALTVASGYDAFKISYFIPAYAPMVFTSFAAASVLFNCSAGRPENGNDAVSC